MDFVFMKKDSLSWLYYFFEPHSTACMSKNQRWRIGDKMWSNFFPELQHFEQPTQQVYWSYPLPTPTFSVVWQGSSLLTRAPMVNRHPRWAPTGNPDLPVVSSGRQTFWQDSTPRPFKRVSTSIEAGLLPAKTESRSSLQQSIQPLPSKDTRIKLYWRTAGFVSTKPAVRQYRKALLRI